MPIGPRASGFRPRRGVFPPRERSERETRPQEHENHGQNAPPRTYEPSRGAEHPDQRRPRRNMRRPLPSPDVRRGRLRAGRPPRRSRRASRSPAGADTTADPFRVVHGPRVRLLPFCERTHRDDVTGRGCRDRSPRGRCRCGLSGQGGMARFGTARRSERDHGRPSGSGPIASS